MSTRINLAPVLALALTLIGGTWTTAIQTGAGRSGPPPRPQGPCDIYAAAGNACVAAHSTTRALYASYNGPLYQVLRQLDSKTLNIGVVQPVASPAPDAGGYANAAAQDAFCANTYCWITTIYDQSPKHNDLVQAPRGGFSGPALGGFNNLPIPTWRRSSGTRPTASSSRRAGSIRTTRGAVDDQAEGQCWVINGHHYAPAAASTAAAPDRQRDDDNGTMEPPTATRHRQDIAGGGAGP